MALHELNRTQGGYDHLDSAVIVSGTLALSFNLAYYACQLERKKKAWQMRGDAKAVKLMALEDPIQGETIKC